jgi:GTP-binding protein HflX
MIPRTPRRRLDGAAPGAKAPASPALGAGTEPERGFVLAVLGQGVDPDDELAEVRELARTAGVEPVGAVIQHRGRPAQRTYVGKGKLEELKQRFRDAGAESLLVDDELDPAQQRFLENALDTRVIDRTQLILDIFAQHATSAEGKLQVELAQLEYNLPRMRGMWQHLERLGGGVGTRGPGESQLESDRRTARRRITLLRRRLKDLEKQRATRRRERKRNETPTVALAGYTNVGKSTLLNALTGADVSVENQLFHTLDPTTRGFEFEGRRYLVTDTVGFIRRLPHHLVEGFASTLEETLVADIVLHVVDASAADEEQDRQREAVGNVLHEIGAGELPVAVVLNKIDRVDPLGRRRLTNRFPDAPQVSALTGEGLDRLRAELARRFEDRWERVRLLVPYAEGGRLAELYALGAPVEEREDTEDGVLVIARLPRRELQRFAPFLVAESRSHRESA